MSDTVSQMRTMQEDDLERVIILDAEASVMQRSDFFRKRYAATLSDPAVYIALVAIIEEKDCRVCDGAYPLW